MASQMGMRLAWCRRAWRVNAAVVAQLIACALAACALSACRGGVGGSGPDDDGEVGSDTHFLTSCARDAECPSGGACLCNVCTRPCIAGDDCALEGIAGPTTCVTPDQTDPFEAQCAVRADQRLPASDAGLCLAQCDPSQAEACRLTRDDGSASNAPGPDVCVEGACVGVPETVVSPIEAASSLLRPCASDADCDGQRCLCSVCTASCATDDACRALAAPLGAPMICTTPERAPEAFQAQCVGRAAASVPEDGVCLAACRADVTCQNTRVEGASDRPSVCAEGACMEPCDEATFGWAPTDRDVLSEAVWRHDAPTQFSMDMALSNRGQVEALYLSFCRRDRPRALPDGTYAVRFFGASARHSDIAFVHDIDLSERSCSGWVFWQQLPSFAQGDTLDASVSVVFPNVCADDWADGCIPRTDDPCGTCWPAEATVTRTCAPAPPP